MNKLKVFLIIVSFSSFEFGCDTSKFKEENDKQFGDQHFKTAIALIELYKIRFGEYPASLDSIKYVGAWDKIAWTSVKYQRLSTGYALDLIKGWVGMPHTLEYPAEFWNGLGLKKSNMKK